MWLRVEWFPGAGGGGNGKVFIIAFKVLVMRDEYVLEM